MKTTSKKSPKTTKAKPRAAGSVAQLKKIITSQAQEIREGAEQQAATRDILRMIARSPGDLQSVMDAIAENAARLCDASDALVWRIDGEERRLISHFGATPTVDRLGERQPIERGTPTGRAVIDRKTIHVHDLQAARGDFPAAESRGIALGIRSTVATPLLRDNVPLGVIHIRRMEVRPFSDQQIKLLETFADQAVIAIENARLLQDRESRNRDVSALHDVTVSANQSLEITPVLQEVVKKITEIFNFDRMAIYLLDSKTEQLSRQAWFVRRGRVEASRIYRRGQGLVGRVAETGEPIIFENINTDPRYQELSFSKETRQSGSCFLALFPIKAKGRFLGTINCIGEEPRKLTAEEVRLIRSMSDQIAVAVDNINLFEEVRNKSAELERSNSELRETLEQQTATSEVLRVIASSPTELQPVLDTVIANAVTLAGANHGHIRQLDGEVLRLASHYNESPEVIAALQANPVRVSQSLAGRAFREGKPIQTVAAQEEPGLSRTYSAFGARSLLAAPLLRKGTPIGNILIWRDIVEPFTERQIDLVKTFADQAVIAIENVRLFKELEARNRDLTEALEQQTATSEILRVIASSPTDIQPVLDVLAESAARLCEAADANIYRMDGAGYRLVASYGSMPIPDRDKPRPLIRGLPPGRAMIDRTVVHLDDMLSPEAKAEFPESWTFAQAAGDRTGLVAPLLREGVAIGAIFIRRTEVRPFSEKQIALLKTFADQAVIAIENVRLFQELKEALEQQTATSGILGVIASSPTDIQPVLDTVAENAARVCGATDAVIFRIDGNSLNRAAHYGPISWAGGEQSTAISRGWVAGRAVVDRRTIHIHDMATESEAEFPEGLSFQKRAGHRTILATPLLREGTPIGTIMIRRTEVRPFSEKQIKLLETFASQAVIAIENVRLFKELQERNAELREALEHQTATAEVLGIISRSPTDVQPVLDAIVESAARVCGIDDVVLRLREGNTIVVRAHFGSIAIALPETSIDAPLHRWMREHGTLHIPDVRAQNDFPLVPLVRSWRAYLGVPLRQQGELIGTLVARRNEVRPFTPAQIKLLETFADQAVIAIENVRLFQELTEALEQQTATSEILGVIASSPTNIQPVLDTVAERAARLCDAVDASIHRFDGSKLWHVSHYGPIPTSKGVGEEIGFSRGTVHGRAVIDRQTVHIPDIVAQIETEFPDAKELQESTGTRTILATPLLREGIPIGVIVIRRTEVRPFSEKQISLLETFADQAVIAIENVRLFKELQDRNRQLTEALEQQTATSDILSVISSAPTDLQPVFDTIAKHSVVLCGALFASVYRFDGELIHMVAHHNYPPVALERSLRLFPTSPGRHLFTARAILDRAVINVADAANDPEHAAPDVADTAGFRSVLAVPMLRGSDPIGAITVWRTELGPFSETHIALLRTFAHQAIIAIENARLFQELQLRNSDLTEALEHQTATAEVLGIISRSPTDVQPVLDAIVESAGRVCGIDDVVLRLSEGDAMVWRAHFGSVPKGRVEVGIDEPVARWLREHGTLHVPDAQAPNAFPVGTSSLFHSFLAVPLLQQGQLIGSLNARRSAVRPFTPAQIKLLETFADQAVIAIENVRLFKELEERNHQITEALEQQTATSEILRAIASSPTDVQPVLDVVAESAARLCDATDANIYRIDGTGYQLVASHGSMPIPDRDKPRPLIRGLPPGRAMIDRAVVHVDDMMSPEAQAEFPESRTFTQTAGLRTLLVTPLLREGLAIGAIFIRRTEVRPFTDKQIALLKTFADQAVIAIENVRLFQELEARTRELTESVEELKALGEVGQAVSSSLDLETVLETIVARAVDLSGTNCGVIYEYDEAAQEFNLRASHRMEAEAVEGLRAARIRMGEGATGQATITRAPVQIPDTFDERERSASRVRPLLNRLGYRSLLTVPLLREQQILGGLTVWRRQAGEFDPEVINLLQTFATQSALAIHNARLFREIGDKNREIEAANQHKSEFLANVSHELRTPLNAIIGFSEVLLEKYFGELNEKQNEYVDDILSSGRHLLSLINDILDLSKIEAGRMELEVTTFHLPDAIENALLLIRERASRHGIKLDRVIDGRLEDFTGDERKIKQILVNLLTNAVKFTPEGGQIKVEASLGDNAVIISVTDTGIGIAKEDQEAIFEEFRQVGTNYAQKREGTGLGLSLTRKFVELHGGQICVESELGRGATFTFTLPIG